MAMVIFAAMLLVGFHSAYFHEYGLSSVAFSLAYLIWRVYAGSD